MVALDPGRVRHVALVYLGAFAAGLVANWIGAPLPWMIGAMVFSAALRVADLPVNVPSMTRPIGQMVVAGSVGLSFTPDAVAVLVTLTGPMLLAVVLTVLAGFAVAMVLMRLAHLDVVTASLASVPIGPVETANLANRHGISPGFPVFAQTMRIMLLVLTIPPLLVFLDGSVVDPVATLREAEWSASGASLMAALALVGALLARLLRIANAFFSGAMGGVALGAAFSLPVTALPYPVLMAAQIFLGVWLGAVFDRALLRNAGGLIPAAFVSTLLMVVLCAAMGLGLSYMTGQPWQVMVLATAPGSVTEMALTAKILQEGIAVVTAFHVVRLFIIMPAAPLIFGVTARLARRYGIGPVGTEKR